MKSILFLFFVSSSLFGFSQFNKGERLIGGTFAFASQKDKADGYEDKASTFSISPEFTYFFRKDVGVGLFASFNNQKTEYDDGSYDKVNFFIAGISLSKYHNLINGLGIKGNFQVGIGSGKGRSYDDLFNDRYDFDLKVFTIGLSPAVYYRFNKHFMLQSTFGRIGFDQVKTIDEDDYEETISQFSAGFMSSIQVAAFFIF